MNYHHPPGRSHWDRILSSLTEFLPAKVKTEHILALSALPQTRTTHNIQWREAMRNIEQDTRTYILMKKQLNECYDYKRLGNLDNFVRYGIKKNSIAQL